ncbi:MAG: 4Fe-4S binding protein [Candidatus Marinimicrobia bacterium]|nr:4Fe-4S binding protein [Candidatus Neomarinimicrobiota bacterium]
MINRIKIGTGSCGIAAGADEVLAFFQENIKDIDIVEVGCIGHCYAEPLVEVETDTGSYFYSNVQPNIASLQRILNLEEINQLTFPKVRKEKELVKVSRLAGRINPVSLEEYKANHGYKALTKALQVAPADVIDQVKIGGLRGRGGGGFPTGMKWSFLAKHKTGEKVLICNADEGDPGAFMDRSLMESIPHQVMEGMLIAAHATGATQIFIYVRAEYPLAIRNLKIAIEQLQNTKLHVIDGREIVITVKEGAGAFVCGEETAMIHSLEGYRGIPRFRPPFPTDSGYKGHPSLINNVETFANIPVLINEGGEKFAEVGTEKSKGTKLFALAGDLKYSGIVEVPMGITIGEVVYEIGGAEKGSVKAVQIGGPSGGCIPEEHFDTPIDYDSLGKLGAIMGSGGLIVIGKQRCIVETARYFLDFTSRESCGKCTFCRVGNVRLLETLEKITSGNGTEQDLEFLEDMGPKIINGSLCGLGKSAPNPVLSTLRFFRSEYLEHVNEKKCRALECNKLVNVYIDKAICIQCGACLKTCPVNAISDDFIVDNTVCTRCNSCIEVCPKNCISRTAGGYHE